MLAFMGLFRLDDSFPTTEAMDLYTKTTPHGAVKDNSQSQPHCLLLDQPTVRFIIIAMLTLPSNSLYVGDKS